MGRNKPWITREPNFDVLYLTVQSKLAVKGLEDCFGILWRFDEDNRLIGLRMPNFIARWPERQPVLLDLLTRKMGKGAALVFRIISAEAARAVPVARMADIEVTDEMINAGRAAAVGIWGDKSLSSIYRAMRAIERGDQK